MAENHSDKASSATDDALAIASSWQRHLAACADVADDERGAVLRTGLFDATFYLETNVDVRAAGMDAASHYVNHGAAENRSPNRWFDANYYRSQFDGLPLHNPLIHYFEHGEHLGFKPHPTFDPLRYRDVCPGLAGTSVSPLWHFLNMGSASFLILMAWQGHLSSCANAAEDERGAIIRTGLFDAAFYLETYADVRESGGDALSHYVNHGAREKRAPNRWFDANYYRTQFGTFPHSINPLLHYAEQGERLGFKPHPTFDPRIYRNICHGLDAAGVSPLWHFLHLGSDEFIALMQPQRYKPKPGVNPVKPPLRKWIRDADQQLGINFISPLNRISGLGVSARGFAHAFQAAEIPTKLVEWTRGFEHQTVGQSSFKTVEAVQPINVIHMNADIFHLVANDLSDSGILNADRYNIGIWYWELSSFRAEWMPWIALLDEIWCASSFNARAIDVVSARPVKLLRPTVTAIKAQGRFSRQHFGLKDDSLVFFYSCDLSSRIDRKNPEALIQAFRQEFGNDARYQLALKVGASTNYQVSMRRIVKAVGNATNIVLIEKIMTDDELADLLGHTFAYVSPHRAEGLGLTIIEAMLSGCPVIATPYGGAADFIFEDIARPLVYDLVEIEETDEPYRRGCVWAAPRIRDIAKAMREMADDPAAARSMGARGKVYVEALFSGTATSRAIHSRLKAIWDEGILAG